MDEPFNEDFCTDLEYAIGGALERSIDENIRRCWCDGVLIPDEAALSLQKVNSTKLIITKAWIDEGRIKNKNRGQFLYEMTIWLGKRSIKRYMNGKSLADCIPGIENDDWFFLDVENRIIEVQLL